MHSDVVIPVFFHFPPLYTHISPHVCVLLSCDPLSLTRAACVATDRTYWGLGGSITEGNISPFLRIHQQPVIQ